MSCHIQLGSITIVKYGNGYTTSTGIKKNEEIFHTIQLYNLLIICGSILENNHIRLNIEFSFY